MPVEQERDCSKSALRANALGLADVLMQGITHTAPATAVLLTIQFISSNAGVTAPLAYLVAFLIVLPLGVSLTQLAKHFPCAGGYYTYVSRTVHPRAGFLTAWLYFLYSAVTPAFSLAMMGGVLESSLKTEFGFVFPWWLFLLLGTGFTYWVTSRGIEISAKSLMILGAIEMGIVVLLAIWSLFDPGSGGVNLDSFNPSRAPSGGGFYLAVVFSIFALTGWEGVVPLAEESAKPRQIMPRAIMGTIIIMGGYLVFTSWGLLIGWGTSDVDKLVASQEMPFFQLAKRFWGPGWIVILIALLNSMLAVAVATTLVSTRMWYAMARSGSLPESLARVHPQYRTPVRAIIFQSLVTLAVGPGIGFWIGPQQEYVLMGTVLTLALVLIYCAGNLGVFLYYRNQRPTEFQTVLHAVFPLLSSVAVLWVGYKSVVPLPPAPVTYAPVIVGGWLALGACVLAVMKWSGREQWLQKAGRGFEETTGAAGALGPIKDHVDETRLNPCILIFLSTCVCFSTTALAQTYTTRFEGEENPLSESGTWRNAGLDWASVRKSQGIAFCTQTGTNTGIHKYDDSYAHLSGFPPDQEAWGKAYIAKPDSGYYQELEILLRWTSSPHRTTGYECFARCLNNGASYLQIVRWEGPLGVFTYLAKMGGTNYGLKNGDILKASIVGNVITVFINGVKKAQVTDDTYKTGNPGIGLFLQCDGGQGIGSNTNFGFASFSARGIDGTTEGNERSKLPPSTTLSKLRVSGNHRYLEDASGKPFFLVGDCPQNLPLGLAATEFDAYMAECESKGFNWLWICIDGQNSGGPPPNPPVDKQGNHMMTNGWNIDTLNDAYFATIDAIVRTAARHNQYCAFTPLSECQWSQANINRNTADKWRNYGRYLGKRYKDEPNIVWVIGNDNINQTAQHPIVEGMKEAGDLHLMTVNWRPGYHQEGSGWIRKNRFGESWIDLNAWYINAPIRENGAPCYWQKIEFERPDPMPSFQCEAAYQQPDGAQATDLACRMQNYYVALGGGCGGQVYGAGWLADEWNYDNYKNNGGRLQTIHFRDLFTNRNWTSLVPDYQHAFITDGYGTLSTNTMDYVGAALNSGTLGLAYCPKSATITADLSKFSGPVKARWYDPTNGKFREIAGSPFPNSGSQRFSTPGNNTTGDGDWVLVLEATP